MTLRLWPVLLQRASPTGPQVLRRLAVLNLRLCHRCHDDRHNTALQARPRAQPALRREGRTSRRACRSGAVRRKAARPRRPAPRWTRLHAGPGRDIRPGPAAGSPRTRVSPSRGDPSQGQGRGPARRPLPSGRLGLGAWSLAAPSFSNVALSVRCTKRARGLVPDGPGPCHPFHAPAAGAQRTWRRWQRPASALRVSLRRGHA